VLCVVQAHDDTNAALIQSSVLLSPRRFSAARSSGGFSVGSLWHALPTTATRSWITTILVWQHT
jgi:hypothetical protein